MKSVSFGKRKKNIAVSIIVCFILVVIVGLRYYKLNNIDTDIMAAEKYATQSTVKVSYIAPSLIDDTSSNNIYRVKYKINPTDNKVYYSRIASYVNSEKIEYQKCQKVVSGKTQHMDVKVPNNSKYKFLVNVYTSSTCSKNKVAAVVSETYTNVVTVDFVKVSKIETDESNYVYELTYKVNPKDKNTKYYSRVAGYVNSELSFYEKCKPVTPGKKQTFKINVPSNSKYKFLVNVYTGSECNKNKVLDVKTAAYSTNEVLPQFENYNYLSIPLNEANFYKGVTISGKEKIVFDYFGKTTFYYIVENKKYGKNDTLLSNKTSACKKLTPKNNYSNIVFDFAVDNKYLKHSITVKLFKDSECKKAVKETKNNVSTNYSNSFTYMYDKELPKILTACRKTDGSTKIVASDDAMIVGYQLGINEYDYIEKQKVSKYVLNKNLSETVAKTSKYKYLFVYDSVGNVAIKEIINCSIE